MAFTAPSIQGQSAVIERALKNAGISPESISYVEAHGTGTSLGDPIEWAALHQVYQKYADSAANCTIGALKTNIGHTDAAAGALGLIKTVLSLKNKKMPATLNFKTLNPEIASFNTLFRVSNELLAWESPDQPRRAAVSSFGIGGTNAHVILEEYKCANSAEEKDQTNFLIPFSAKNRKSLFEIAAKIKNDLESDRAVNLHDYAFTAQFGRAEFSERGYFLVSKSQPVIIASYLRDSEYQEKPLSSGYDKLIDDVMAGQLSLERAIAMQEKARDEVNFLNVIAWLWSQGFSLPWDKLNVEKTRAQKIRIPRYSFSRKHYEIPKKTVNHIKSMDEKTSGIETQSLEIKLKEMWSDVLGVAVTEITDASHFLKLGGDSLAFIDLVNNIKKSLLIDCQLEEMLDLNEFGKMHNVVRHKYEASEYQTI